MTKKGEQIGKNDKEKKKSLAAVLESFESSPGLVKAENLQKTIKMIKSNIETADKVLENSAEISESDIYLAQKEGYETFADFENKVDSVADVTNMLKKMSQANDLQSDENVEKEDVDELIENELKKGGKYQEARFKK